MANTPCPRDGGQLTTYLGASQPADQTAEMLLPLADGPPTPLAVQDATDELAVMIAMQAFTQDIEQAVTVLADGYQDLQTKRDGLLVWLDNQERAGLSSVHIDTVRDGLR